MPVPLIYNRVEVEEFTDTGGHGGKGVVAKMSRSTVLIELIDRLLVVVTVVVVSVVEVVLLLVLVVTVVVVTVVIVLVRGESDEDSLVVDVDVESVCLVQRIRTIARIIPMSNAPIRQHSIKRRGPEAQASFFSSNEERTLDIQVCSFPDATEQFNEYIYTFLPLRLCF